MTLTVGRGGGLHKSGQRSEYSSCLARMFEPVLRPGSFGLIAHDFGEPQDAQNIADARDASTGGFRDLARFISLPSAKRPTTVKAMGSPQAGRAVTACIPPHPRTRVLPCFRYCEKTKT